MDLEEFKELKHRAENEIADVLKRLNEQTGCPVFGLYMSNEKVKGRFGKTLGSKYVVKVNMAL